MFSEIQENNNILDLIVVGGGINGAGVAADAAGRGLMVGLYDSADFCSDNAVASSSFFYSRLSRKEPDEMSWVSETLTESEILLKKAPHLVKKMPFRVPCSPFSRPAWMIRMGFFVYDHLVKPITVGSNTQVNLTKTGLQHEKIASGFEYSDYWIDETRLVLLNAMSAKAHGAEVKNYCRVVKAIRVDNLWVVTVLDTHTNIRFQRKTRALVNATGPSDKAFLDDNLPQQTQAEFNEDWLYVKPFFNTSLTSQTAANRSLIRGLHLVVPRIHQEDKAYLLSDKDNNVIFVIPYLNDFSIIGSTDIHYQGDPQQDITSSEEIVKLLEVVNQHFSKQLTAQDVLRRCSRVRPVLSEHSNVPHVITGDHSLTLEQPQNQAPLVTISGGQLTTYRKLAESAMRLMTPYFEYLADSWTANATLPGSDFNYPSKQLAKNLVAQHSWLSIKTAERYVNQFGTLAWQLFAGYESEAAFGIHFGNGLYSREIDYCMGNEFAKTAEDILWRRTKLGLYLCPEQQDKVTAYIQAYINRNIDIAQVS